ncbi:SemiSWEET family transporter [Lactobacillus gasseri]|nr:SemiSWEET family transporter [Lactobacillus gasseri]MCZ3669935.1 SemiSWEET family transporter [Lactobacillus gasseri]
MKKKIKSFDNKTVLTIGRIGSVLSVLMYVSYIPQIMNNLQGNYGNPIQPLVAAINCLIWVLYALLREKKDWPLFVVNFPGILFGLTTFITSLH